MSDQLSLCGVDLPAIGDDLDFWETPEWATRAILPFIPNDRDYRWSLVDPCAGRGAMIDPLLTLEPCTVAAVEIHAGRFEELRKRWAWLFTPVHGDCLALHWRAEFPSLFVHGARRLVVTNPPYTQPRETIGLEIAERCLEIAEPDGFVAMLLPLDFASGVLRAERIHDKHRGSVYPLRRRPKFGGTGTGQRPLAWFTWDLQYPSSEFLVL